MAVVPRPKRQKFDLSSSPGIQSLGVAKNETNLASIRSSEVRGSAGKSNEIDLRIQQAKNYAVAQALQDACTDQEHVYVVFFQNGGLLQKQIIAFEITKIIHLPVSKQ